MKNQSDLPIVKDDREDVLILGEALRFLVRRCEQQGFYSPTRQPLVLRAYEIAMRRWKRDEQCLGTSECGAGDDSH